MLKRIVDWLLYTLHLKKRPVGKSGLETLMDILPYIFAVTLMVDIVNRFNIPKLELSWYERALLVVKQSFNKLRVAVVGY